MADDAGEETLDPRVQIQLEKLNTCTDEINRLEVELDDANSAFRATLSESSHKLRILAKKLGKSIEAARPYYEAKEYAQKAQLECQRAAVQYQRASEVHQAAKETISLAEQRFLSNQTQWEFDNAWQEMLNHATMKEIKSQVEVLRKAVIQSKQAYTDALHSLEQISTEIHERRKAHLPAREPGVGAEHKPSSVPGGDAKPGDPAEFHSRVLEASMNLLRQTTSRLLDIPGGDGPFSKAESESYGSLGSSPSNGSTFSLPTDLSKTTMCEVLSGLSLQESPPSADDEQQSPVLRRSLTSSAHSHIGPVPPAIRASAPPRICSPDDFEEVDLNAD
ncbi:SH3 domain-binding protein 5 homolog isoform X2 [Dermacentor silvarum]|uniref:SH3 domain-binding protein 5 homolog isoform X2 n=1 Tax=Dermacentor silvarum TaxID=543639 RepID=UPI002100D703|nr:SH3 domain-binding protein 5 homolog isoform X2 [Dermacentor silvarum]